MGIKSEPVLVTINIYNKDFYVNKGLVHASANYNTKVIIDATELLSSSTVLVTRICDNCGAVKKLKRLKINTGLCRKCQSAINGKSTAKPHLKICPKCGGKKASKANVCKKCLDIRGPKNHMYGKKMHPKFAEYIKMAKRENHPNWKGGISKRSGLLANWARGVKEQFNNTCDVCGYNNKLALEAHHLESYDKIDSNNTKNFDLENGVCLCSNCHKIFHKVFGFGKNTKDEYKIFKTNFNIKWLKEVIEKRIYNGTKKN